MSAAAPAISLGGVRSRRAVVDPPVIRWLLTGVALLFLALLLVVPVAVVFVEAFKDGIGAYFAAITAPDTLDALRLTVVTAAFAVALNLVFGLAAAWLVARFEFPGKTLLVTAIDLPFAVSPVIAGMQFILLFGARGYLGPWLEAHDWHVVFAPPGIVLATSFVTFPFVARELIPFLEAQGPDEEHAALVLGASGWTTFWRITIPNARWALLYGIVLCNARAMGEFGAVSVVSGHVRGQTNTLPLHVEVLYGEYKFSEAFAVASLLVLLAVATLVLMRVLGRRAGEQRA